MAIVARRVLQQLIYENASFVSLRQRERHVAALNCADDESLSTEWEILVLNGLAKLMSIQHESAVGSRNPDVFAELGPPHAREYFVADIATAYESGYHDRNPVERVSDEIRARANQLGLHGHGFDVTVDGAMQGAPGKQQMVLKIPDRAALPMFLKQKVEPFLNECAREPTVHHELRVSEEGTDLQIKFMPNSSRSGMTYPSFTTNYSKTRNSIYNILKRKARQLRDTGFDGPRGIILCAADADLRSSQGAGHGLNAITSEIFRLHSSLAFVLTLWALDPFHSQPGEYRSDLYLNPDARYPLGDRAIYALQHLASVLPEPRNSGINALNQLRFWRSRFGEYFYGSWQMNAESVQISARVLMEYLAGRISQAEFVAIHGGNRGLVTLFEQKLRLGQLLVEAEIRHEPERDDDWVLFRFGPPDPAAAPFKPK